MRKIIILGLIFFAASLSAQRVSNAAFQQSGKQVEITYSLDKQADITVYVSTDGGKTYGNALTAVTGDVGKQVAAGTNKRIVWSPLEERERLVSDNVVFKIVPSGGEKLTFTVGGVSFIMIKVEGGTFTMGATSEQGTDAASDEKPTHSVTLSDYYIGQTEVTQGLWKAVMGTTVRQQRDKADKSWPLRGEGNNYPMYYINWEECQAFVNKLNSLLFSQLVGRRFALPTEAQWEYAARGGKKSKGYKYSGSNTLSSVAWYDDNSGSSTHTVATKSANELGLYDMSGNVCEWCQDWYGDYSSGSQSNPSGPSSGSARVGRGGGWRFNARNCRVSYRNYFTPTDRGHNLGFRVVLL